MSLDNNTTGLQEILEQARNLPDAGSVVTDAVRYNAQVLTEAQKAQARENIGVLEPLIGDTEYTTPTQVADALGEGRDVLIVHYDETLGTMSASSFTFTIATNSIYSTTLFSVSDTKIAASIEGSLDTDQWTFKAFELLSVDAVPNALPNPNKLTFTGAASGAYDGSAAKTVNIPTVPASLKNPYALTINGTAYDGSKAVSVVTDPVPSYVRTEAERVAKVVQGRQNANTITFLACSDIHYYSPGNASSNVNADKMHEAVVSMGQAMGLIRERCHIDFAAMFGDMTWDYGETHDEALAEMRLGNTCLSEGFGSLPQLRMEGNHDDGYESGASLTAGEIFANIGAWNEGAVYGDRAAGYCYRDFDSVKLRVIALNSSQYSGSAAQYNAEQVTWLAKALNLSEKGAGWRSIILGHHPLDWGRNGGTDPTATINAASGLIASFHGHIHNFLVGTVSNTDLPRIGIPNAGYSRENQYGESYGINWKESTTYSKTPGTATNTSFCVVTIDTAAKKIFADHYGAGYDRVIPYDDVVLATYTVTNNLTNVTNSSSATEVEEGWSYSATLTAFGGYAIASVVVKMGGVDITSTAYSGGKITISSVTGDIVITAVAVESDTPDQPPVSYTNLVPTSIDPATQAIYGVDYNGDGTPDGYKNDVYGSGAGEGSSADANCVLTGLITYGNDISTPIYVKGADVTTASHCRILGFDNKYDCYFQAAAGSAITTYFTVETLDASAKYYKVTPIRSAITGQTDYLRFSLINPDGGANLIITVGEPIE